MLVQRKIRIVFNPDILISQTINNKNISHNKSMQERSSSISSEQAPRSRSRPLPRHFRQVKYQQNRPVSPQRQARKDAKRQERNNHHKQLLNQYKEDHPYYDNKVDEWNKEKYYLNLPKNPTYESLNRLLSSTFAHARRRDNIFPIVDRHPDYTLKCVYSGRILSDSDGNLLQKCDEEHSFPQSYQRGTKAGTGRDMHAIFAASKSANGSRGNTPFGLYSQKQIPIQTDQFGTVYSSIGPKGKKTYIPKLNSGAVARSTLYILTCYKNCANETYLPKQTLKWLINEASSTQVSLWEKHRNAELHRLQGNRNPYIDHPEWALQVDFSEGWQK